MLQRSQLLVNLNDPSFFLSWTSNISWPTYLYKAVGRGAIALELGQPDRPLEVSCLINAFFPFSMTHWTPVSLGQDSEAFDLYGVGGEGGSK